MDSFFHAQAHLAQDKYIQTLITLYHCTPSKLYCHLKSMRKSNSMPVSLSHDSITVTDLHSIVHLFNNYFNSVYTKSNFLLQSVDKLPTPSSQFNCIEIDESDVHEVLMSLNISKASGCDGISPYFLKLCAGPLLTSQHYLLFPPTRMEDSQNIPNF